MRTIRAMFFPREEVPLAISHHYQPNLNNQRDEWRETDRYLRTPEFCLPIKRQQKWVRHGPRFRSVWEQEDYDG